MSLSRHFLYSNERRKLCKKVASVTFAFAIATFLLLRAAKIRIPDYRLVDLLTMPVYAFLVASLLTTRKAMDEVWAEISAILAVVVFLIAGIFGFLLFAKSPILAALYVGVAVGGLAELVAGNEYEHAWGFCLVFRVGFGFGFGIRFGFLYALLILMVVTIGCAIGLRLTRIFSGRFWRELLNPSSSDSPRF